jgi:hypothetical protein
MQTSGKSLETNPFFEKTETAAATWGLSKHFENRLIMPNKYNLWCDNRWKVAFATDPHRISTQAFGSLTPFSGSYSTSFLTSSRLTPFFVS